MGWGQPDRTHSSGSITYLAYSRQGITAAVRDDVVVLILTSSERHRTEKGTAVGQAASAALAAYGTPSGGGDGRHLWYDAIGLLLVTGGRTIIRIGIYNPRTFARAILAEEVPARDVFLSARPPVYAAPASPASRPAGGAPTAAGGQARAVIVTVTLKNSSRSPKVLNPNFFTLKDREGQIYRYDRSTFSRADACRSTVSVRVGEEGTCSLIFVVPAGRTARSITFDDGASADEHYF
jgi:hypothetical protein